MLVHPFLVGHSRPFRQHHWYPGGRCGSAASISVKTTIIFRGSNPVPDVHSEGVQHSCIDGLRLGALRRRDVVLLRHVSHGPKRPSDVAPSYPSSLSVTISRLPLCCRLRLIVFPGMASLERSTKTRHRYRNTNMELAETLVTMAKPNKIVASEARLQS